jgi:hypothetical protein
MLRALAADCGVSHTTLGRCFARAEAVRQLREASQSERRAAGSASAVARRFLRSVMLSSVTMSAHFAHAALRRWARSVQTAEASSGHDHAPPQRLALASVLFRGFEYRSYQAVPAS